MSFEKTPTPKKGRIGTTKSTNAQAKSKWWLDKEADIYVSVFGIVDKLRDTQSTRHLKNIQFARLYENLDVMSYALGFYESFTSNNSTVSTRPTWNVVKSCIDTVCNKISKSRPKVEFVTEKGSFKLQQKAKNLTQYLEGLFDLTNAYQVCARAFSDACKFGTGAVYVYISEDNNIKCERVLVSELIIDEAEGIYESPQQIHRRKLTQRDQLKEMFPKFKDQIESARTFNATLQNNVVPPDMVMVVESWHLASGPKAEDGRHAICIDNCTLQSDSYTKTYFPFVFYRWCPKTMGFWGSGLAEELAGSQLAINKLLRMIEIAQERMATPRYFIEAGSAVSDDALINGGIGDIITYTGTPPSQSTPAAISPEIYRHVDTLYNRCYEICGVSQLSAMSEKPKELSSGIAMSTYEDIQTERMALSALMYEKMFLDLGKIMIDFSRDCYEEKSNITVKVVGSKFIKKLDWKKVSMDEDEYSMRGFPVSLLPSTPAGKLSTIVQLMQANFIPKEYALSLLDMPDLEQFMSIQNASLNDTNLLIQQMLEDGKPAVADPYMNLTLAIQQGVSAYLNAKVQGDVPEKNMELLRNFIGDCKELISVANPPPPPQLPAMPQMPGMAVGGAAPQSALLPTQ